MRTTLDIVMVEDEVKHAEFLERMSSEVRPGVEATLVARDFDVSVVMSSQGLACFPGDVLRNVAFKVVDSLVHSIDKEYVLRGMGNGVELIVDLLVRGHYVVRLFS